MHKFCLRHSEPNGTWADQCSYTELLLPHHSLSAAAAAGGSNSHFSPVITQNLVFTDLDWSVMQEAAQEPDEDTAELGMAANSILQSIPPHVLKALEQQQVEANAVNAESKVSPQ